MEKEEVTKRFNSAGKSLKQAGIAFILIPVVALIVEAIISQMDMNIEDIKNIAIASKLIYSLLCIVIASCLISAGSYLIGHNTYDEINSVQTSQKSLDLALKLKDSPITLGKLDVLGQDLGKMKWDEAVKTCKEIGEGWRLPSKDELNTIYENKDSIGGLVSFEYWSADEYDFHNAWTQNIDNGKEEELSKTSKHFVRAVRSK